VRWLLALLLVTFTVGDVLGLEMSLAPGLSVKNALLYLIVFALVFRRALSGSGERPPFLSIHVAFFLVLSYAVISWMATAKLAGYPGYHLVDSAILLKVRMLDPAIMLFAALYAVRDLEDARFVLKFVFGTIAFANVATLADTVGLVHLHMRIGESGAEEGRVFGAYGHANDTGSLLVCMLPGMAAMFLGSRGFARTFWFGCALATFMVLVLTVSRGAFVGLAVGGTLAAFMCRRYVPLQRLALLWVGAAVFAVVAVLVASLVDPHIGETLSERLLGQSRSLDVGDASSGRTIIWITALERMMQTPTSFLTGLGWGAYSVMPFRYAPHNFYLGLGFDLGIFAVALVVLILARSVLEVRRTIAVAEGMERLQFIAFVFGIMCLAVALMFADLYKPWPYVWLYIGVMLRMVLLVRRGPEVVVAEPPAIRSAPFRFSDVAAPSRR
jgi:O-antigen ligase